MKTTLEIPDNLLKEIKLINSNSGVSTKAFGAFKHLKEENQKIMSEIDLELGKIDPEEWK